MKHLSKLSKIVCTVLLLAGQANLFTGCNDDMPAESYYTFTGEMMSDFLTEHENFSLFKRIAERAGKMDFLGSRGSRTFFPATNAGVEAFLKEKGYASVEDIPASFCDTLLRACIIERIMYTYDLPETQQENNELDLPVILESKGDTLDANQMALTIVNRRAAIINELKNDSVEKYSGADAEAIFGLNQTAPGSDKTYKQLYWNKGSLTHPYNPLNMFLSYHIIDRLFSSTAKLVNTIGIHTAYADPTDWVSTLLDFSTIKLEKVYRPIDPAVEYPSEFYVNHCHASQYNNYERIRGAHLTVPEQENFSLNVAYYYIDDVVAYDPTMRNTIMNTRMRIDFQLLWPELTNNNMRLCGNPLKEYNSGDNSEDGTEGGGFNYYLPPGYLKNITFSENTMFIVKRPIIYWSNYQGDDIAVLGTSYDVTFRLPNVPPGEYELRLGYCALDSRGIGQVYVDGIPQGLPIDMRDKADAPNIGGLYNGWNGIRSEKDGASGIYTEEELQENARTMKNNGYYSAPKGVYYYFGGSGTTTTPAYDPSKCVIFYNQNDLLRRKICQVQVQPNKHHTIRLRSVLSSATSGGFSLDYMELVPISICGPGGIGEDIY